jgi:hypothetical protein
MGSRHEKATFLAGIGRGLAVALGLGEVMATGVVAAAGEAAPALGTAGAAQAQTRAIAASPTHLMPVERTPHRRRYSTS